MSNPTELELRKIFLSIAQGYSTSIYESKTVFIKHFNLFDQQKLDDAYEIKLQKLIKQGIQTKEELLQELIEQGKWSAEKESEIQNKENFLKNLIKTKESLILPSQIEQLKDKIEKEKKVIEELREEKTSLLSNSAESFASRYLNDENVFNSFFSDAQLKNTLFTREEFDELDRKEIYSLVRIYNKELGSISLSNIKHLALSGLFSNYFNVSEESPYKIFDKKPLDLTFYQLNLITYCKIFKSIFKNIPDIPDDIRDNPDELLELIGSSKKTKEKIEKIKKAAQSGKQSRAQSIVGATKKDLEKIGGENSSVMSPQQFLKSKGKTSFSLLDGDFNV